MPMYSRLKLAILASRKNIYTVSMFKQDLPLQLMKRNHILIALFACLFLAHVLVGEAEKVAIVQLSDKSNRFKLHLSKIRFK